MFTIENLNIQVESKTILKNIDIEFKKGKNYCILGPNGSGKSSLALTIMGHPKYIIKNGELKIENGQKTINLSNLSPDKRAKLGIFLAFQHIPEIEGVKLFEFLRNIYNAQTDQNLTFLKFKELILPLIQKVGLDREFLRRDLNVGFSGGERRKVEILQIKLLKPQYIFLDEVDSGLDIDSFRSISKMIKDLDNKDNCFIFITHHFEI
ncbi:MAG TPA: Fe-S cluster assembly ATPase SufC, partial [Candidatus Absconditabacterales bacterium]|nr:Fe-S cluster assembly ATPase SufC [Candidatus Absconditabacterales bacterium]